MASSKFGWRDMSGETKAITFIGLFFGFAFFATWNEFYLLPQIVLLIAQQFFLREDKRRFEENSRNKPVRMLPKTGSSSNQPLAVASVPDSLLKRFPEIAAQWHPAKNNDLSPDSIPWNAAKKVWWKCDKEDDHEWIKSVQSRTSRGTGCPHCFISTGGESSSNLSLIEEPKISLNQDSVQTNFCSSCGTKVKPDDSFCSSCGNDLR